MSAAVMASTDADMGAASANVHETQAVTDAPMASERPTSLPMALVRDVHPVVSSISPPRASTPSASASPTLQEKDEDDAGEGAKFDMGIGAEELREAVSSAAAPRDSASSAGSVASEDSAHRIGIKAASKKDRAGAPSKVVCCRHGAACKAPRKRMMLVTKSLVDRFRALHPELVISNSGWCCGAYRAQMYRDVSGKPRREKPAPAPVTRSKRIQEAEEAAQRAAEAAAAEQAARLEREAEERAHAAAMRRAEAEARSAAARRDAEARTAAREAQRRAREEAQAARRFMTEQRAAMRNLEARERLRLPAHATAYAAYAPPVVAEAAATPTAGLNLLVAATSLVASDGASMASSPASDSTAYSMVHTPASSVGSVTPVSGGVAYAGPAVSMAPGGVAMVPTALPAMPAMPAMPVMAMGTAPAVVLPHDPLAQPMRWAHAAPAPGERAQWVMMG